MLGTRGSDSRNPVVLLGDVVGSARIKGRLQMRRRMESACALVNRAYRGGIRADFKMLKGIDEVAGVLDAVASVYDIVLSFLGAARPHHVRFVAVRGVIDVGLDEDDVSAMDGPVFAAGSEIMARLKRSGMPLSMHTGDRYFDATAGALMNSLILLRHAWSDRQHEIVDEYEKRGNQTAVARRLHISQQAVSDALRKARWREIGMLEGDLKRMLARGES
jgi:hypothetical protein